jgi:hypothetical protein
VIHDMVHRAHLVTIEPTAPLTFVHGMVEVALTAARVHANPLLDVGLVIDLRGPGGEGASVDGFWDGGRRWCFRFSPHQVGSWTWRARLEHGDDDGLSRSRGALTCVASSQANAAFAHGPLEVHESGSHLCYRDGTPFFWLADTAWNGVIRAEDADWERYLDLRREQGFSVIQFVATHWRGSPLDPEGQASCTEVGACHVNPAFFRRIDRRVALINAKGLIAAPVGLWSLYPHDLGPTLATEDAIRMLRYVVARYGAHQVVWLVGGDGQYLREGVERWRRIGRSVFRHAPRRLATLHPCGLSWVGEAFRSERWFDVIGYQSGHGDADHDLHWLTRGPPARDWQNPPLKPVINLEANYESALGYTHQTRFDAASIRRAAYWSLLLTPTAGVSHGHWGGGRVEPWHAGLTTPGVAAMTTLRRILDTLPWWTLRPHQELLLRQPVPGDPQQYVVAAQSIDGHFAIVYTPAPHRLELRQDRWDAATWINPRDGSSRGAEPGPSKMPPGPGDWLLLLHGGRLQRASPESSGKTAPASAPPA